MAARLRSRLSFARRKGAREQEAEPGTPVTGQVSGYYGAMTPPKAKGFSFPWVGREAHRCSLEEPSTGVGNFVSDSGKRSGLA